MLSVTHNLGAMNASRQFNITRNTISKSSEKLSSGYKINRAADDAAGLTISEKMRSLVRGLNQGSDNIQEGISLMQVADGALSQVDDMLHRMTELSVKAANGTNTEEERQAIQKEINQISSEITRIGKSTTFNTMHILDYGEVDPPAEEAPELIRCESAPKGFMGEAYPYGGRYYPAAILDFSGLDEEKIQKLNDKSFSFVCGYGCGETFRFTFREGTGADLDNPGGGGTHNYTLGTDGITTGADLASALYNVVINHPITGYEGDFHGGVKVSHASGFAMIDSTTLAVFQGNENYSTPTQAANAYPVGSNPRRGLVDCAEITRESDNEEYINKFSIQCSNVRDDCEVIETYRMNAAVLGIDPLHVGTEAEARAAIDKVKLATDKIGRHRSAYGAFQNRLEHSYRNNTNKAENTQAAESRIRDTDMASEMVRFSTANILSQAGISMLSQASQNPQSVLQLLQ